MTEFSGAANDSLLVRGSLLEAAFRQDMTDQQTRIQLGGNALVALLREVGDQNLEDPYAEAAAAVADPVNGRQVTSLDVHLFVVSGATTNNGERVRYALGEGLSIMPPAPESAA